MRDLELAQSLLVVESLTCHFMTSSPVPGEENRRICPNFTPMRLRGGMLLAEALKVCAFRGRFTFSMSADGAIANDQTLVDEEDRAAEVGKRAGGIVYGQEDAAVVGDDNAGLGLSDGRAQDQA